MPESLTKYDAKTPVFAPYKSTIDEKLKHALVSFVQSNKIAALTVPFKTYNTMVVCGLENLVFQGGLAVHQSMTDIFGSDIYHT